MVVLKNLPQSLTDCSLGVAEIGNFELGQTTLTVDFECGVNLMLLLSCADALGVFEPHREAVRESHVLAANQP